MNLYKILLTIFLTFNCLLSVSNAGDISGKLKMFDGGLFSTDVEFNFDEELRRIENLALRIPEKLREEAELFLESQALKGFMLSTSEQLDALITKGLVCSEQALKGAINTTIVAKNPISKKCIRSVGERCSALTLKINCPALNPAQLVLAESCELKEFVDHNSGTTNFLANVSAKSESLSASSRMVYLCGTTKENGISEISLEAMWLREAFLYIENEISSDCKTLMECAGVILAAGKSRVLSVCDQELKEKLDKEYSRIERKIGDNTDDLVVAIMQTYLAINAQAMHEKLVNSNNDLLLNNLKSQCSVGNIGRVNADVVGHDKNMVLGAVDLMHVENYFQGARMSCMQQSVVQFRKNYHAKMAVETVELDHCGMGRRTTRTDCDGEKIVNSTPPWTGEICP